jgi:DNA polymerase kappa
MPGFIAKKLCPNLVIVKSNFAKYEEVSKEIREILANYDPLFAPMGLDEAYLDLTQYILQLDGEDRQMIDGREEELFDDDLYSRDDLILSEVHWDKACAVVSEIRQKIFDSTQLTASAGIAVNKMLAKIASDMNKPDGQFFVKPTREEIMDFIRNLAIRKVSVKAAIY